MRVSQATGKGGLLRCFARNMRISSLCTGTRRSSSGSCERHRDAAKAVHAAEGKGDVYSGIERHGQVNYFPERWNALLNDFHAMLNRSQSSVHSHPPSSSANTSNDSQTLQFARLPPFPLFKCPFCTTRDAHRKDMLESCEIRADSGVAKGRNEDLFTPQRMTTHLSWVHPMDGAEQRQLNAFNDRALKELINEHLLAMFPVRHSDSDEVGMYQALRIVVIVDVANMEFGCDDVIYTMLQDEASLQFFSAVPCAFIGIHEMFLTHTSRVEHVFYMLSRLHPLSYFTVMYAAPRTEGGDFVAGDVIGQLLALATPRERALQRDRASSWDGRVVLITKDMNQKACLKTIFDDPASHRFFATPKVTLSWLLRTLREASRPC